MTRIDPLRAAPLLPIAAAFALGIVLAPPLLATPASLIGSAVAFALAAVAALVAKRDRLTTAALLGAVAAIGALHESWPAVAADHLARRALPTPVTIEGRLAAEPIRWSPERSRLLVDVESYLEGSDRRPASGRIQLAIFGETAALGEGQRIRADARLHRPIGYRNPGGFDYPAQLRREGILLIGNARGDRIAPTTVDAPPWNVAVKRWAVETIRSRLPETSAALLAGLLLGERTALPRDTDESFRRAGVYHLLAVSGFNVALLASSVFVTLALVGVPRRGAALVAAVVLVAFACVVGGQPSVLRATVMGLLLLLSVLLERESQVLNALALAAVALLLWDPNDLRDPGFQLSFAATAGIVYLAPPLTERLEAWGWPAWLSRAVAASAGAQIAVTPIMVSSFNQLSLIGVAANLVVVPLAAPATTLGMLALALAPLGETPSQLCFEAVWLLLVALRAIVHTAAAVPGAMVHLPAPSAVAVLAWYAALTIAPISNGRRLPRLALAGLAMIALAASILPWLAPGDGRLRVTFLDVGQGDAAFVELPEGPRLLVDGGPGGVSRLDVGERVIAPFLWNRPLRRIDVVALTHADADHAGGLAAVLRRFSVGEFWENGSWRAPAEETRQAIERTHTPRRVLRTGDRFWIGHALITVLNPDGGAALDTNDESLVLRIDWRGVSLLLSGDLGWEGEERLREERAPLRALVLKVGHHGSRYSSSAPFLNAARPTIAVVSVGARNPFRHPSPEALDRLMAAGARIYRTDRDGAIVVESDGTRVWVTRWARGSTDVWWLDPETRAPDT